MSLSILSTWSVSRCASMASVTAPLLTPSTTPPASAERRGRLAASTRQGKKGLVLGLSVYRVLGAYATIMFWTRWTSSRKRPDVQRGGQQLPSRCNTPPGPQQRQARPWS